MRARRSRYSGDQMRSSSERGSVTSAICFEPMPSSAADGGCSTGMICTRARARRSRSIRRRGSRRLTAARPPRALPAATSPSPGAMRASAVAPSIEVSMCEPCGPVVRACQPSPDDLEVDAHGLLAGPVAGDRLVERRPASGAREGSAPCMAARAGRTKSWKPTIAETGIAGQAEDERVAARAEPGGLAGAQADAPEALLHAQLGERGLDVVVRADRHAAGDDHHVGRVEHGRRAPSRVSAAWSGTVSRAVTSARRPARPGRRGPSRSSCRSRPGRAAGPAR